MFKFFACLVFLVVIIQVNSSDNPDVRNIQDIINFTNDVKQIFSQSVNLKDKSIRDENNPVIPTLKMIDTMSYGDEGLEMIGRSLDNHISKINNLYKQFLEYAEDFENFNENTITEFVEIATIDGEGHLLEMVSNMKNDIIPQESEQNSLYYDVLDHQYDPNIDHCGMSSTIQQKLLQLHNLVISLELKALVIAMGAYNFQETSTSDNSTSNYDKVQEEFITRVKEYLKELKVTMEVASREIYSCDSETHDFGQNYIEFDGLFSAIVYNELQEPSYQCKGGCEDVNDWGGRACFKINGKKICPFHYCKGRLNNCESIGSDVDVCEEGKESRKRYRFVRSYQRGWFGKWDKCSGGQYYEYRYTTHHRQICETCMCSCSQTLYNSDAIRTFSLRPQLSDINGNKVVSNVRFALQDDVIHIQIEESPLLESGEIDRSQASWVPLETLTYVPEFFYGNFTMMKDGQNISLVENKDFAFITADQNILNVDEISAGSGYVLTGVRLNREARTISDGEQSFGPVQLEIHATPYDYSTGELNPTEDNPSVWITVGIQPNPDDMYKGDRIEITVGGKGFKYESSVHHTSDLEPNRFVRFQHSSIYSDIGQSTIPFFDSRPVETNITLALNGIGIFYRQAEHFAGLLALELITIDLAELIRPESHEY